MSVSDETKIKAGQIVDALLKHRQLALDVHERLAKQILRVWHEIRMDSPCESTVGMLSVEYNRSDGLFASVAEVSFAPWREKPFAKIGDGTWSHEYDPGTPPEKIMAEVDAKLLEMGYILIEGPMRVTDYTKKE